MLAVTAINGTVMVWDVHAPKPTLVLSKKFKAAGKLFTS